MDSDLCNRSQNPYKNEGPLSYNYIFWCPSARNTRTYPSSQPTKNAIMAERSLIFAWILTSPTEVRIHVKIKDLSARIAFFKAWVVDFCMDSDLPKRGQNPCKNQTPLNHNCIFYKRKRFKFQQLLLHSCSLDQFPKISNCKLHNKTAKTLTCFKLTGSGCVFLQLQPLHRGFQLQQPDLLQPWLAPLHLLRGPPWPFSKQLHTSRTLCCSQNASKSTQEIAPSSSTGEAFQGASLHFLAQLHLSSLSSEATPWRSFKGLPRKSYKK